MLLFLMSYVAAINLAAYFLMGSDKRRAQQNEWRISEGFLLTFCFIGGFIGIHLGMQHFRHKTKHWQFHTAVIASAVLFLVILPILFWQRMAN